ncbi:MAG: DNA mismatch repair protein MutS [Chloroflexaceae bacterium]|nr:DNA mismatch repair protein MutS [Chloroflexaceae bacterium]
MLSATSNNYLAAAIADGTSIGLAYADLSTGEFAATELSGERATTEFEGELARLQVAEILISDDETSRPSGLTPSTARLSHDLAPMTKDERDMLLPHERVARRLDQESGARWSQGHVTAWPAWRWELNTARDALLQQFAVQSLAGLGLTQRTLATRAAGAILQYIHETQRSSAAQMTMLRVYATGSTMFLDPQTRRNLELLEGSGGRSAGSLVRVLDQTRTPMGARLMRKWIAQPLLNLHVLQQRQEAVATCVEIADLRKSLRQALADVGDMERAVNRVLQGTPAAMPRDLVHLRQALRSLPQIVDALADHTTLLQDDREDPALADTDGEPYPEQQQVDQRIAEGPAPRVLGDDLFAEDSDPVPPAEPLTPDPSKPLTPGPSSFVGERRRPKPLTPGPGSTRDPGSTGPASLDACGDILTLLETALDDDPPALLGASNYLRRDDEQEKARCVIRMGYDQRIDDVIQANQRAQNWIDSLERREREQTGLKALKVGYNKVFGYYIEVSRNLSDQVPGHYERKQTLVNSERYITAELKEYENIILSAQQNLVELERQAFTRICEGVCQHGQRLRRTAQLLARLDAVASLAEAAVQGRYTRPTLNESTSLKIQAGRHPVVERSLADAFVPNDMHIDTEQEQLLLITGPNMAGKSTVLRQVALIVLLAQIGSFVPAEHADVGLVDRIFTRIGAQDDIATGQSTFMVEMTETAALLLQSSRRSLIILDEVGRGTSTYDGMAIARAVVEYIHNEPRLRCRTLFATHYHELTALTELLPRVRNYHMEALEREDRVVFLYELRPGGADRSYGIHVAELAGIPRSVIRRARELLAELEQPSVRLQAAPTELEQPSVTTAETTASTSTATTPAVAETEQQAQVGQTALQPSLFDVAPNPVVTYLKRLNINELTPLEAMTRLYELQKLAQNTQ